MGLKKKAKKVIRPENKWLRYCVNLILIALIFTLGIFVGNGKISFSRNLSQLTPISAGLPNQLNYSSVNEVYQALKNNYYEHLTETQLLNGLKHGLAESTYDPTQNTLRLKKQNLLVMNLIIHLVVLGPNLAKIVVVI